MGKLSLESMSKLSLESLESLESIAADSNEEAAQLATTQQMSFADLFAGRREL